MYYLIYIFHKHIGKKRKLYILKKGKTALKKTNTLTLKQRLFKKHYIYIHINIKTLFVKHLNIMNKKCNIY